MQKSLKFVLIFFLSTLIISCVEPNTTVVPRTEADVEAEAGAWPTKAWRTSKPEDQGMDAAKLTQMFDFISAQEGLDLHSLLIIRNGTIVTEKYWPPYSAEAPHTLYSCTKSFISALVGIALEEGYVKSVDQKVVDFFPDLKTETRSALKEGITIEDLLNMQSGLDWKEGMLSYISLSMAPDAMQYMLDLPMASPPGEEFLYCSGCTHLLSGILQEATGMGTQDFAQDRLLAPLGIDNFTWEADREGTAIGGWGLEMTPRDMAKFGFLYLQNGVWDGEQIVPAEWIQESIENAVQLGPGLAYGYQWWVFPELNIYAAQGMEGQKIYVIPDYEMVVVMTAELQDTNIQLKLVEEWIMRSLND